MSDDEATLTISENKYVDFLGWTLMFAIYIVAVALNGALFFAWWIWHRGRKDHNEFSLAKEANENDQWVKKYGYAGTDTGKSQC